MRTAFHDVVARFGVSSSASHGRCLPAERRDMDTSDAPVAHPRSRRSPWRETRSPERRDRFEARLVKDATLPRSEAPSPRLAADHSATGATMQHDARSGRSRNSRNPRARSSARRRIAARRAARFHVRSRLHTRLVASIEDASDAPSHRRLAAPGSSRLATRVTVRVDRDHDADSDRSRVAACARATSPSNELRVGREPTSRGARCAPKRVCVDRPRLTLSRTPHVARTARARRRNPTCDSADGS